MVKRLEFYNPYKNINNGKPIMTSNYIIRMISTKRGKRKQAIADYKGKKFYKFVSMDFKK